MREDLYRLLAAAHKAAPQAEWIGLRRHKTYMDYYAAVDGKFSNMACDSDEGIMVEVLYKGHFSYAATQNMTTEGIAAAAAQAFANVERAAPFGIFSFTDSVRPPTKAGYASTRKQLSGKPGNEVFDTLISACDALHISDEIIQTVATFEKGLSEIEIVSTNGAEIAQALYFGGLSLGAVGRRGDIVQQRTANGPRGRTFQGGWELFNPEQILTQAKQVGAEVIELLSAEPCPNDTRTLVLMPDQLMLQIHESIGHALEIDRILGDERNFAGGSFIKIEDVGNFQYGSKLMNVSFNPGIAHELASYAADEIGNIAQKEYLIKDGILVRALGSLESQQRSKLKGVANQRATSWNRPPIDRMANINLEPGTSSFEDIISSIEKGILMRANRSWTIDDYRNKFQFGCEYGQLIENGKLTKTVRDPNYRGISRYFWNNLCAVGDESTFDVFGTPNCGKGEPNQVIFVGHASPVCAFSNVEVFGGGK
ncbi:TldD/PmbA family protein [Treponema phagedenis]|uniref:TldD/PmbA family protein n=1 Tax=Treponema phagedenis TaxID=162 RepID=UPI00197DFD38|nr:TldD/PmbA family protein [Treponema phagedenis]QSH94242.1 Zn-dependent protease [Treponema phagedenis]